MKILFLILGLIFSSTGFSHPTSYKGALTLMSWNQPWLNETWSVYSYSNNKAVAVRYMRAVRSDQSISTFAIPQLDFLAKRWNGENFQANIYIYGGLGNQNLNHKNGAIGLGAFEVDAETRKYFVSLKSEWMGSTVDTGMSRYEARIGIAPYEAAFDELSGWLMLQYQYQPWITKKQVLTPLARFFYKAFLVEVGSSFEGDYMTNFMFHF